VELTFVKRQSALGDFSPYHCETLTQVVLNHDHMVHEETTLGSFISGKHLKKTFFSQELSLLLSSLSDEALTQAPLYIKHCETLVKSNEAAETHEEGEISTVQTASGSQQAARYQEVDRGVKLREALEGCLISEYPTIYVVVASITN